MTTVTSASALRLIATTRAGLSDEGQVLTVARKPRPAQRAAELADSVRLSDAAQRLTRTEAPSTVAPVVVARTASDRVKMSDAGVVGADAEPAEAGQPGARSAGRGPALV